MRLLSRLNGDGAGSGAGAGVGFPTWGGAGMVVGSRLSLTRRSLAR